MNLLRAPNDDFNASDAAQRKRQVSEYRKLTRDPVTGLMQAHAFLVVLEHNLERAERAESPSSLLFVWLAAPTREIYGDERLLALVARHLRRVLRGEDALARLGDGFLILLSDTPPEGAEIVSSRLAKELWRHEGLGLLGRWSVNSATAQEGESARRLIERASAPEPGLARSELPREPRRWRLRRTQDRPEQESA